LGADLFQVEGIERVLLGYDFISIGKQNDKDWDEIKPFVF
jgi:hypothetical protein